VTPDATAGDLYVAAGALFLALGATDEEIDRAWGRMQVMTIARDPMQAVQQARSALAAVRAHS